MTYPQYILLMERPDHPEIWQSNYRLNPPIRECPRGLEDFWMESVKPKFAWMIYSMIYGNSSISWWSAPRAVPNIAGIFLGSNAEKFFRHCSVPLLSVCSKKG